MLIGASRQNVTTGNIKANLSDIRTTMENKELIFTFVENGTLTTYFFCVYRLGTHRTLGFQLLLGIIRATPEDQTTASTG